MAKVMLVNKKRRGTKGRKVTVKRKSPTKRRASRRRKSSSKTLKFKRNPSPRGMLNNVIERQVKPAAIQAAGALGLDIIYGYLSRYIPVNFTGGALRHFTKGLAAVAISAVASNLKVVKASTLNDAAKGALTVVMHDAGKELIGQFAPQLPLSGVGYYSSAMIARPGSGMGMYERTARPPLRLQGTPRRRRSLGIYASTATPVEAPPFDSSVIE